MERGWTVPTTLSRWLCNVSFAIINALPEPAMPVLVLGRASSTLVSNKPPMPRLLLIEDDEEVGPLLEHVLIADGYEVDRDYATAGAYRHLESHSYDLVITDARLPDGTGMAVADRAIEKGAKALVITGYAALYPELARYEYLLKPIRAAELLAKVARLLGSA
jgi:DNA-binding NtrC family response regulator